jgi:FHS family L-fucose permease-like MFS transporter
LISAAPASAPAHGAGMLAMLREGAMSRWALLGAAAIFIYVGAEVAIGTQLALFLNSDAVWGVSLADTGKAVSLYWGGAMVGRVIGAALLARVNAAVLLAIFTAAAAAMCGYVAFAGGVSAGYVALAIGLFNSVMFPTIFTLTLERSTARAEATSGLLCTAIVGGAFIPPVVGLVSGGIGYTAAFAVPMLCYAALCLFALGVRRAPVVARGNDGG